MEIKILIVEDEADLRDTLAEALQKYSFKVNVASGVKEALFLIKMNNFDIIITDKNMPGRNGESEGGMQVLKYAEKLLPGSETIIMTAFATTETVIEAMRSGAFDYIIKPFQFNELKEKIDKIIEIRNLSDTKYAISLYKEIFNDILKIARREYKPSDTELHKIVNSILKKIEPFFKMQKETTRAFKNISQNLERVKERVGRENPIYKNVLDIRKELDKQFIKIPDKSLKPYRSQ